MQDVARRALAEGADGVASSCSHDEASLLMARDRSILAFSWALRDHRRISDATSWLDTTLMLAPRAAAAKAAGQHSTHLSSALCGEGLVDGLVAHVRLGIVRMLSREPPRDLLGRPELLKSCGDLLGQGSALEIGDFRPPRAPSCLLMGVDGPVVVLAAIGGDLSGDPRRATPELLGDRGQRLTKPDPDSDRLPLMIAEPISARLSSIRDGRCLLGLGHLDPDHRRR